MSSSTLLYSIQRNLFRFGGPVLLTVGSISCILNLMVFAKNTLRKNPCTTCFVAINIINFLYLYLGLLFVILAAGYDIDPSASNVNFCRFRFYNAPVLSNCESSFLILASIDRTLITSSNAGTRKYSTHRLVYISAICIILFWSLYDAHAWVFTEIVQLGPDSFFCDYQPGTYSTIMAYNTLIINGAIPLLLIMIFGFWTLKNVRQVRRPALRSVPTNTGIITIGRPHKLRSKDRQLIQMLLLDIILFVTCRSPVTIIGLYRQITQYENKSAEQEINEQCILQITYFVYFIENSVGCYTNILVSKTFRIELKRILSNARRLCFH
jgi:hypothetical protein